MFTATELAFVLALSTSPANDGPPPAVVPVAMELLASESQPTGSVDLLYQGPLEDILRQFSHMLAVDPIDLASQIINIPSIDIWPMWTCVYRDGTIVYNKFRFYRSHRDVTLYFLGQPGSHDRDAFYYGEDGRRYQWDTRWADDFARQHGGIVRIEPASRR